MILVGVPRAGAFALLGPLETWQTFDIGFFPGGADIGGPKNLVEEYRWNQPVLTYAFDPTFLNYFGTNGVNAVEEAFGIITNGFRGGVSTLNLNDFPLRGKRLNQRAATLGILDLKTYALGAILEEIGLASPERYTWTIRERSVTGTPPITNSLVIMRNFDPDDFKPTNYVNGVRYTYTLIQTAVAPDQFDAVEFPVDPTKPFFTAAASIVDGVSATGIGVTLGEYFSNLTRDDVGGLRYLYSPANLNVETTPTNALQFAIDTTNIAFITNFDLALLSSLSATSSPAQLEAYTNFPPGLIVNQSVAIGAKLVTNSVITFTNLSSVFTNFNNLTIVTNGDLFTFSSFALTSAPAAFFAAFPIAPVATSTNLVVTQVVQIVSITTNFNVSPWGAPGTLRPTLVTNFGTNLTTYYHYTFANVLTNADTYTPFTRVDLQTLELDLSPFGDPNAPFVTNVLHQVYITNLPSGNFTIFPANTAGYVPTVPPNGATNIVSITNNVIPPLIFGVQGVIFQQDQVHQYTNVQYAAYPIELSGPGTFVRTTNDVLSVVAVYANTFANVRTNHFFTDAIVTNQTLQIIPDPRPGFPPTTNLLASSIVVSNFINGDFDIIPLTGFPPVLTKLTNEISVTNVLSDLINPVTGEEERQIAISKFEQVISVVRPVIQQPANPTDLRPGVDAIRFVKVDFDSVVGQTFAYTNIYSAVTITNGLRVTNTYQIIQNAPNFLFSAAELPINRPSDIPNFHCPNLAAPPSWINDAAFNSVGNLAMLPDQELSMGQFR